MGALRYVAKLSEKSSITGGSEGQLIKDTFSEQQPVLDVIKKYESYKNINTGAVIFDQTKDTIRRGHLLLAQALFASFKNPLSHQEPQDLKMSEIYTEQDCLDALGLLSHLFRRLDNAERVK